jgi:hypothetical protein
MLLLLGQIILKWSGPRALLQLLGHVVLCACVNTCVIPISNSHRVSDVPFTGPLRLLPFHASVDTGVGRLLESSVCCAVCMSLLSLSLSEHALGHQCLLRLAVSK